MTPTPPAPQTKIFGIPVGAEPKKLAWLIGIVVVAIVVYLINSQSDNSASAPAPIAANAGASIGTPGLTQRTMAQARAARTRRTVVNKANDRGVLKLRPINGSKGDIDPTLRLDLLSRLQSIEVTAGQRNLFGMGPVPVEQSKATKFVPPKTPPIIPGPTNPPGLSASSSPASTPIPLKFYGFIQSRAPLTGNRGFFLKGDDVLVGSEGEVLLNQFRVIQLGVSGAVMEDTASKNRQTLPLIPEVRGDS